MEGKDNWNVVIPCGASIKARIEAQAKPRRLSKSWVVKTLLEHALAELEAERIDIEPVRVSPVAE